MCCSVVLEQCSAALEQHSKKKKKRKKSHKEIRQELPTRWKEGAPEWMGGWSRSCPLVPGSYSQPLHWDMYNFEEKCPPMEVIGQARAHMKEWLKYCRAGPADKKRWPLQPLEESCMRTVSSVRGLPAFFHLASGEMANPNTFRDNLEFMLAQDDEHAVLKFAGGDWKSWAFMMRMRREVPRLAKLIPLLGPLHQRFNTLEGIRDLTGEPLLWACALSLGWTGLKYTSRTYQKMEDLIVIVTCGAVRALELLGLPFDHIFERCEDILSAGRYDVRVRYLIWYVNYLGGMHCYMRVLARAGQTVEWLGMFSTLHKFYHVANMRNYATMQPQFFYLLLRSGLTVQDLNFVFNALFFHLNPFNMMCMPLDDVSEQVAPTHKTCILCFPFCSI